MKFGNQGKNLTCVHCGEEWTTEDFFVYLDGNEYNILPTNILPVCRGCYYDVREIIDESIFISVSKKMSFAAAHRLPHHAGKCCNWHGHEWFVEVTVKRNIDEETGMTIDYGDLKKVMEDHIISVLDHGVLNTHLEIPTAENLLVFIWEQLMFKAGLKGLDRVTIWEAPDSKAELKAWDLLKSFRYWQKG